MDNPFDSGSVARRYARGRRYYHDVALNLALAQLNLSYVGVAVDIGCGTGLSTCALRNRADRVIAVDISSAMLQETLTYPQTHYVVAAAEQIPLRDAAADLVTVAAAFHWFDQPKVFAELARVLHGGGGLAVYSDFFLGRIAGIPEFTQWFVQTYLPLFPTPRRHAHFDTAAAGAVGFSAVFNAETEIWIPFTRAQLADFLLSQSNAATAMESGTITAIELHEMVVHELTPFIPGNGIVEVAFGIRTWTTTLYP